MGEIKSTLDLVLEKTKHLKLSEKERQEQTLRETRGRLKGLLEKYSDRRLSLEQVQKELAVLKKTAEGIDDHWLLIETLIHVQPDRDNTALVALMRDFFRIDATRLESALIAYARAMQSAAEGRSAVIRETLSRTVAISGSAVVPNLESDREWTAVRESLRAEHAAVLEGIKAGLVG